MRNSRFLIKEITEEVEHRIKDNTHLFYELISEILRIKFYFKEGSVVPKLVLGDTLRWASNRVCQGC
ncbi:Uncharacterized protein TCM_022438 [Theobroma cacao]|uniref:Uncharacterized protein n=1 Tax=Theobroma cacao TaxID=3641 RepID=A0A061ETG7_THECC|nr:Uncharacterized protein TCM_022438 [Theobroma cacao]